MKCALPSLVNTQHDTSTMCWPTWCPRARQQASPEERFPDPRSPSLLRAGLGSRTVGSPPATHQTGASSLVTGTSWRGPSTPWSASLLRATYLAPVSLIASALACVTEEGRRPPLWGQWERTLRRLTVKSLLVTVSEDTTRYFRPSQLGFGTVNGCEPVVHATRRWLQSHRPGELVEPDRQVLRGPESRAWIDQLL